MTVSWRRLCVYVLYSRLGRRMVFFFLYQSSDAATSEHQLSLLSEAHHLFLVVPARTSSCINTLTPGEDTSTSLRETGRAMSG